MKTYQHILLLTILAIFTACQPSIDNGEEGSAAANKPEVQVVKAISQIFEATVEITGNLEAEKMVKLFAMEGGFVRQVNKDIGDYVSKGQIIARLQNPELLQQLKFVEAEWEKSNSHAKTAQASQAEAQAHLTYAQKTYQRIKGIFDKTPDLVTVENLDKTEADFHIAEARLQAANAANENAQSNILSAKALADAYRARTAELNVKAPFSGYITHRYVNVGDLVTNALKNSNAQPIVDIADVSKLRLVIEYPESDLGYIKKGTEVVVHFPEIPGKTITATITRLAAALNPQSKTMRAEVDLMNKDRSLSPGMYAKVQSKQKSEKAVLTIPKQAITAVKNQNYIFVVRDHIVSKIPVQLGIENKDDIEVTQGDLKENDLVVIQGKTLISDGLEVIDKEL